MASNIDVKIKELSIDLKPQLKAILSNIGNSCASDIRKSSPRRTGKYAAGWTSELLSTGETVAIYNKSRPSLTHLLELGHRSRSGRNVPPQEHIRPAYNRYQKIFLDDLKQIKITPKK